MDTKAVIIKKHWKDFFNEWERDLKDSSDETKNPFFWYIRGLVTPYRKKYGLEAGLCDVDDDENSHNPVEATKDIVNRHYATIKFLIVSDPEIYKDGTKIDNRFIFTPETFFNYMDKNEKKIMSVFMKMYKIYSEVA